MLSRFCLTSFLLIATTLVAGPVLAGNVVELPSDVSVSLVAEPTVGLEPGDIVTFTISVTNNGPEVVDRLTLSSSFFVDELDVFAGSVIACEGPLLVAVSDFIGGYEYWIDWDPVTYTDPALLTLEVGESGCRDDRPPCPKTLSLVPPIRIASCVIVGQQRPRLLTTSQGVCR